ncbi:MAG: GGDEF domain-containing protein, partial [Eubacteriales bacterium]
METQQKLSNFIDLFSSPFFAGSIQTKKLFYLNKAAQDMFQVTCETCDFAKIFDQKEKHLQDAVSQMILSEKPLLFYNITVITATGDKLLIDLHLDFFNAEHTEICLVLHPQNDIRLEMALYQINQSTRAEAILHFDETLTILHCNHPFYAAYDSSETLHHSHFQNHFINGFPPEQQARILADITHHLTLSPTYATKLKIRTATGEDRWYLLELERRTLDHSGNDKIMAYMTSIKEQIEFEEEHSLLQQYFDAMQELSQDVLFRIDLATHTLHHQANFEMDSIGKSIPNYIKTTIRKKILSPHDIKPFLRFLRNWISDHSAETALRFSLDGKDYKWYNVTAQAVTNDSGALTAIVGKLTNIQGEKELQNEYSILNQYFSAMQSFAKDILFHIDIDTKTFYHSDSKAQAYGVPVVIEDYVEAFISSKFIRPEDADTYREANHKLLSGENMEYEIRAAVASNVYEWFRIKSQFIYSDRNHPKEIFGTMENIQWEKDLKLKATHDLMTKVLNKVTFEEEVSYLLEHSKETDLHALIFIDLDDFKSVNDTLGHAFGDSLLISVGKRLKRVVRTNDLVGRIGGDEFAVFLQFIGNPDSAIVRANLLLETLQRTFHFDGNSRSIKASLGVSVSPSHGTTYKELLG